MHNIKRLFYVAPLVAVLIAATLFVGCSSQPRTNDEVIVAGSTTILPIVETAAEDFTKENPSVVVLASGMGSAIGIEAVSKGTADVGASSRDLRGDENDLGLFDTAIAYDGIVPIVNTKNPVKKLTLDQLRDIYSGKITNWSQVGGVDESIDLVNRDEASGTREAFKKIVMRETSFDLKAAVLPGTGQVRDVVARSTGAIGYISVGFVESKFTDTKVNAVTVDGIEANDRTVADGTYPISRDLHLFTKGKPKGIVKSYIDFILSPWIQETLIKEAGFVPVNPDAQSDAGLESTKTGGGF